MLLNYVILYLFFIILASLLISYLVWKVKLPSPRLVIGFLLIFVVSPLIIGYLYFVYFNSLPEAVVPDVTGIKLDLAAAKLEAIGLRAREAGSIYETRYPEGYVASQRPEANRRVKLGRVVNLIVSSGKRKIAVPNLLGRPLSQAETVLSAAGLQLGEMKKENNVDAPDGTILAQEPLPGEEVETGRLVDLLVSTTGEAVTEAGSGESREGGLKLW
jgi:beta-lactam-binding protein with PASTA domain